MVMDFHGHGFLMAVKMFELFRFLSPLTPRVLLLTPSSTSIGEILHTYYSVHVNVSACQDKLRKLISF
jgi:hypothetical protein